MKKYVLVQIIDNKFSAFVLNEKIGLNFIFDTSMYEVLHNNIAYPIAEKIVSQLGKYYKNIKFIDAIFYKAVFADNDTAEKSTKVVGLIEVEIGKENMANKMLMSFITYMNTMPTIINLILLGLLLLGSHITKILSLMAIFLMLSLLYYIPVVKGNVELEI